LPRLVVGLEVGHGRLELIQAVTVHLAARELVATVAPAASPTPRDPLRDNSRRSRSKVGE
jgi:hypothetical protein